MINLVYCVYGAEKHLREARFSVLTALRYLEDAADQYRIIVCTTNPQFFSSYPITIEPLDDYLVIQPLDESETASGLIVPTNEAAQCLTGIVAAVGPEVSAVEPGDKVLYPREAGYEVRAQAGGSRRPHPRLRRDRLAC